MSDVVYRPGEGANPTPPPEPSRIDVPISEAQREEREPRGSITSFAAPAKSSGLYRRAQRAPLASPKCSDAVPA
jgi:hypothetical protein